jgi:hypothetical protein
MGNEYSILERALENHVEGVEGSHLKEPGRREVEGTTQIRVAG